MIASTLVICPRANRQGGGQVFLRDGHGGFVDQTDTNRDFNGYAATDDEVIEKVRAYLTAIREMRTA